MINEAEHMCSSDEIEQLKSVHDQLAKDMACQSGIQLALDQKDQIEEHLKIVELEVTGHRSRATSGLNLFQSTSETIITYLEMTGTQRSKDKQECQHVVKPIFLSQRMSLTINLSFCN